MDQEIVNWLLTGFGALIGALLNAVWQAVKDLQAADKLLTDEVGAMKVLVAGDYVRKEVLDARMDALFNKIDKLSDKVDTINEKVAETTAFAKIDRRQKQ